MALGDRNGELKYSRRLGLLLVGGVPWCLFGVLTGVVQSCVVAGVGKDILGGGVDAEEEDAASGLISGEL